MHAAIHSNPQRGGIAPLDFVFRFVVTVFVYWLLQQVDEFSLQLRQFDSVLRALWTRHTWLDGREIEIKHGAIIALAFARHPENALRFEVAPYQLDLLVGSPRRFVISARLLVYREEAHRRTILGRHIGNGCSVGY